MYHASDRGSVVTLKHACSQIVGLAHIQTAVVVGTKWEAYLKLPVNLPGITKRLQLGNLE